MVYLIIEKINWLELVIGSISGTLFGLFLAGFISKCKSKSFTKKHLSPLKGIYKATYKNGVEATAIKEVNITAAKNKTLFIEIINQKGRKSNSEIFFESARYGRGWYMETEDQEESGKSFGYREIIINPTTKELYVWNRYTKDKAYGDKADFRVVNQSYVWVKR